MMLRGVRDNQGQVQTAVRRFQRADGRRVSVVATVHYARAEYFHGLRELIAGWEAAGAVVHCEGARPQPVGDDPVESTPLEAELAARWKQAEDRMRQCAPAHGYASQTELVLDRWRSYDLTRLQMVQLLDAQQARTLVDSYEALANDPVLFQLKNEMAARIATSRSPLVQGLLRLTEHPILVRRRRERFLTYLHADAQTHDVVLVAGAGHHKAICRDLRRSYQQTNLTWHTARPSPPPLRPILRQIRTHKATIKIAADRSPNLTDNPAGS